MASGQGRVIAENAGDAADVTHHEVYVTVAVNVAKGKPTTQFDP